MPSQVAPLTNQRASTASPRKRASSLRNNNLNTTIDDEAANNNVYERYDSDDGNESRARSRSRSNQRARSTVNVVTNRRRVVNGRGGDLSFLARVNLAPFCTRRALEKIALAKIVVLLMIYRITMAILQFDYPQDVLPTLKQFTDPRHILGVFVRGQLAVLRLVTRCDALAYAALVLLPNAALRCSDAAHSSVYAGLAALDLALAVGLPLKFGKRKLFDEAPRTLFLLSLLHVKLDLIFTRLLPYLAAKVRSLGRHGVAVRTGRRNNADDSLFSRLTDFVADFFGALSAHYAHFLAFDLGDVQLKAAHLALFALTLSYFQRKPRATLFDYTADHSLLLALSGVALQLVRIHKLGRGQYERDSYIQPGESGYAHDAFRYALYLLNEAPLALFYALYPLRRALHLLPASPAKALQNPTLFASAALANLAVLALLIIARAASPLAGLNLARRQSTLSFKSRLARLAYPAVLAELALNNAQLLMTRSVALMDFVTQDNAFLHHMFALFVLL